MSNLALSRIRTGIAAAIAEDPAPVIHPANRCLLICLQRLMSKLALSRICTGIAAAIAQYPAPVHNPLYCCVVLCLAAHVETWG
jgi:hypothetical protein